MHIVHRGHHRGSGFFGEEDYDTYLHGPGEALKETSCGLLPLSLLASALRFSGNVTRRPLT